jgi:hypothetical protein
VSSLTPIPYTKYINKGLLQIYHNPSYEGLLRQTIRGRTDGAYSNYLVSKFYLKHIIQKPNALIFNSKLPYTTGTRHLSSIKHPNIIREFNAFLKNKKRLIEQLKKKYQIILPTHLK